MSHKKKAHRRHKSHSHSRSKSPPREESSQINPVLQPTYPPPPLLLQTPIYTNQQAQLQLIQGNKAIQVQPLAVSILPSFGLATLPTLSPLMRSLLIDAVVFRVKHKVDFSDALLDVAYSNSYTVYDQFANTVFLAFEQSSYMARHCLQGTRAFTMQLRDVNGVELLTINRPYKLSCFCCCFMCCPQRVSTIAVDGTNIGYVVEDLTFFRPRYSIQTPTKQTVLYLSGPVHFCLCRCNAEVFQVHSADDKVIGHLTSEQGKFIKELHTSAELYSVYFPGDLPIEAKVLLLSALFLIQFTYLEGKPLHRTLADKL